MSATTAGAATASEASQSPRWPKPEPLRFKVLVWGTFVLVAGCLALYIPDAFRSMKSGPQALLPWLLVVASTDLLSVPLWGTTFAISFPILIAAGMVFPPAAAGAIAIAGSTDLREFRGEVTLGRSLYNRSQIALSVMAGSWVFHMAGGDTRRWPLVLPVAIATLAIDGAVNLSMLTIGWHAAGQGGIRQTARRNLGTDPMAFVLTYASLGLAALLLAVLYEVAGTWGLMACLAPALLGQQALAQRVRVGELAEAVSEKNRALLTVSEKIADERRDERLAVAAGLHDELLPPLYKVHLMGQVLRQDLATGRLLDLEGDIPELLGATEEASQATQTLILDLKRSALGAGGLTGTLRLLVRDLEIGSACRFRLEAEEVGGSPVVQLLAYQVAREALRNAVRHAEARNIRIELKRDGPDMRLMVEDDGRGFDPQSVKEDEHFGLQLMRERVELAGGVVHTDTSPGAGTRIVIRLPAETAGAEG